MIRILILAAALIAAPWPALARWDGIGSDHAWFESLKVPRGAPFAGMGCCSEADCKIVEARPEPGGRWSFIADDGRRYAVPPAVVLDRPPNPKGAVACIIDELVICFVPPLMGF